MRSSGDFMPGRMGDVCTALENHFPIILMQRLGSGHNMGCTFAVELYQYLSSLFQGCSQMRSSSMSTMTRAWRETGRRIQSRSAGSG